MAQLSIYTSEGEPYDDHSRRKNDQIQEFFFDGVRLAADFSRGTKIVCFFRAREQSGRAEQYYAVYDESRRSTNPFQKFVNELRDRVEGEHGLQIDTGSDDTAVFTALANDQRGSLPGSDFERSTIDRLLGKGQRLRVGVRGVNRALGLGKWGVSDGSARSFAIADNTSGDTLQDYDLAIETGAYSGIEPLGSTAKAFENAKREQQSKFVSTKVSSIRSDVQDLRAETDLSSGQIRRRLKQDLNVLDDPKQAYNAGNDDKSGLGALLGNNTVAMAGTALILVLIVALAAATAVAFLGVNVPIVSDIVGGDDVDPAIEGVGDNGDWDSDNETITFSKSTISINTSGLEGDVNATIWGSGEERWKPAVTPTDESYIVDVDTDQLTNGKTYRLWLNTTEQSVSVDLVYEGSEQEPEESTGEETNTTETKDPEIAGFSGSGVEVPENGTVRLNEPNPTITVNTTGFEGDINVDVTLNESSVWTATNVTTPSGTFELNTTKLNVTEGDYEVNVTATDESASAAWNLTYDPPAATTIETIDNATKENGTITILGNATLEVTSEYNEVLVEVLPEKQISQTYDVENGTAEFTLDASELPDGEEYDLKIATSDGDAKVTWPLTVDTNSTQTSEESQTLIRSPQAGLV